MYYVYVLKSIKDDRYYIGSTRDLIKRLSEHNNGKTKSTKNRRPFILIGYKEFKNTKEAKYYEYKIKHNANERYKFLGTLVSSGG